MVQNAVAWTLRWISTAEDTARFESGMQQSWNNSEITERHDRLLTNTSRFSQTEGFCSTGLLLKKRCIAISPVGEIVIITLGSELIDPPPFPPPSSPLASKVIEVDPSPNGRPSLEFPTILKLPSPAKDPEIFKIVEDDWPSFSSFLDNWKMKIIQIFLHLHVLMEHQEVPNCFPQTGVLKREYWENVHL